MKPAATIAALTGLSALCLAAPVSAQTADGIVPLPLQPVVPASQRTCTTRTSSGLGYTELRKGTGPKAGPTDYVLINYIGYLAASGQVFDQAMTTPMTIDGVIPGFSEGLKLVPRGGVWRFCVPAALGYGKAGSGPIPADADLVFQVELVDSRTTAEVEAMRREAGAGAPPPTPANR